MAQKTRSKPAARGAATDSDRNRRLRSVLAQILIAVILISGGIVGLRQLRQYVERDIAFPTDPLIIVLKNRPQWMSDGVAGEIAKAARPMGAYSSFDRQMLVDVRRALQVCPWVEHVNEVRRAYTEAPGDTLELDCDYRVPTALVHWGQFYWLVDRQGVKLPEQFGAATMPSEVMGADGRVNLRIIDGVRRPPPEAGVLWQGDDLAAGLEMATVLFDRPYTEEILKIDVSNIDGRDNADAPQIALVTRYGTSIFWGRPPSAGDAFIEIRPDKKLQTLADIYAKVGRVDMRQPWIDIRFDGVRYAAAPAEPTNLSASIESRR